MPHASTTMCGIPNIQRSEWTAFARFPTWMWRNNEVREFVDWLREHNAASKPEPGWRFTASISTACTSPSAGPGLSRPGRPRAAKVARQALWLPHALAVRPRGLRPRGADRLSIGLARRTWCAHARRIFWESACAYAEHDGERFFGRRAERPPSRQRGALLPHHVLRLARVLEPARQPHVRDAEELAEPFTAPHSKAIVWAHNSHVGDSAATEMVRWATNTISAICVEQEFGAHAYLVGFGTNSGTVAAASDWDGPMEIKRVRPALPKAMSDSATRPGDARFRCRLRNRARPDRGAGLDAAAA